MFKPFRTAAVLGAGVMGSQIAAHLANAGLTVYLLDLPSPTAAKNALVEMLFKKAKQLSPPIFFSENSAQRVILGNYDDDFERLATVDWVIEAVVENLAIKQQLMQRLEAIVSLDTVISSNTSGLQIGAIAQGLPATFSRRFLGTHFFNPPRYLKLLELIPTPQTDPQVLERVRWFGELHLGKGIVVAHDTPNFIANRIGMFTTMQGLSAFLTQGYTIEEIDTLTGPLVGRPKSATFRTADLVGLDTLLSVLQNLYPAIPEDEAREIFQVPEILRQMVETGTLGAKTRQGFYKKQGHEILSIDPQTLTYTAAQPLNLPGLENLQSLPLGDRLRRLYQLPGRAGDWFRMSTLQLLNYSAHRIPEIAASPLELDRALRWGFGWEAGPFEIWEMLGYDTVRSAMQAEGLTLPAWVQTTQQFYHLPPNAAVQTPAGLVPLLPNPDHITVAALPLLWENAEAALRDLGNGVVLYEFRSKGNTLSFKVVEGLAQVLDQLETQDYRGLVIGNDSDHFSGGANLMEMGGLAQAGDLAGLSRMLETFQTLMQRLKYFPKPVVSAVVGRALGGGCELVMASPHVVAAAESYIGLVELSVGLIPGAGGLMRMATRISDRAASSAPPHLQPWLKQAFETIGMAKVSNSAEEAQQWGFLPCDAVIVRDRDRLLAVAKTEVLRLSSQGYLPPPVHSAVTVLGLPGRAMLEHAALVMRQAGWISDYDQFLAGRLAYVLTGGDLTGPTAVHEDYLLALERQVFLPLLAEPKTQARILHLLTTKKPLRN